MSNSSMSTSGASYMCTSGDSLINSSYGSVQPQELLARFVYSLFGKKCSPSFIAATCIYVLYMLS